MRRVPARSEPAPAKVNLFLHVGAKRRDGYHDLTSLVVFPEIADVVMAGPDPAIQSSAGRSWMAGSAKRPSGHDGHLHLAIDGPFAGALAAEPDNLVLRAAQALSATRAAPATQITLTKNLPIASGIGGGSADAAATLRVLNEAWGLRLTKDELRAIGLKIGSDVPVCIDPVPQWMEGRGERVERGPKLPEFYVALVNPGVPVPTGPVFKALVKKSGSNRPEAPKSFSSARSLAAWLARETRNDLQAPAIEIAPPVAEVLECLDTQPGCLLARMSGSGATCFGVFETAREAKHAAASMPKAWWAKAALVQ